MLSLILALIVTLISYSLAVYFYDTSWDGQGYHQETIYLLKNGWNPITEGSFSFRLWVNLYQKGNEIIQANIYFLSQKIEAGKLLNLLFVYIAFVSVWSFLNTLALNNFYKLLITCISVYNPVVFTQVFTYYIDGNWYLTLLISISSLLTYFSDNKLQFIISFVLSSVLFCSMKFTSIPIFIIFSSFALAYRYLYHRKILFLPYISIFFLSLICNIHPFITNLRHGDHLLHPFLGNKKIDIINSNIPNILLNKNRGERILFSLFSQTTMDFKTVTPKTLKIPFTFNKDEFFINFDTRLGGFGFLFSGILFVAFILFLIILYKKDISYRKQLYFLLLAILVSVLINPASWWSRLSAQIWLVPIVIMIIGLLFKNMYSTLLSRLLLVIFSVNILIPGSLTILKLHQDNKLVNEFISSVGNKTVILDLSNRFAFQQYYLKFKERKLKYKIEKIDGAKQTAPFTPDVYYKME